jgi:Family of unknown function (DUF5767)
LMLLEEERGVKLTNTYNIKSSLDEIKMEYLVQKERSGKKNGISDLKKLLIFGTTGIEQLTVNYAPDRLKMKGFSQHFTNNDLDDFDEVLGRLYDKHGSIGELMSPEMELLYKFLTSCVIFLVTKNMIESGAPMLGKAMGMEMQNNNNFMGDMLRVFSNASKMNTQGMPQAQQQQQGPTPYEKNMSGPTQDINSLLNSFGMANLQPNLNSQNFQKQNENINQEPKSFNSFPVQTIPETSRKEKPISNYNQNEIHYRDIVNDNMSVSSMDSDGSVSRQVSIGKSKGKRTINF